MNYEFTMSTEQHDQLSGGQLDQIGGEVHRGELRKGARAAKGSAATHQDSPWTFEGG